ncbi:MAG TPA: response regulator transcription factor [Actinomycetales bacterium]|nr:response regulator transcription factor [Actinomycetales bacterium]
MSLRVVVADDQALVRAGFCRLVDSEADLTVVGEAGNGADAVRIVRSAKPDVALLDIRMPVMDGIEATRRIVETTSTRVVILTLFDLDDYVFAALQAGASGFLLKDSPADQLLSAIRVAAQGDALIAPSVTRRLLDEFAALGARTSSVPGLGELTDRERQVLTHVAAGLSNAEIAAVMFVGEATVKTHVGRVLAKLGVRDRVQAVVAAYESGLVRPGAQHEGP